MKWTTCAAALATISVLSLAACGGGSGSQSGTTPPETDTPAPESESTPDPAPEPEPTPEPEPEPEPELSQNARAILGDMISMSNTVTDASTIDGEPFLWEPTVQPTPSTLELSDMTRWDDDEFRPLPERRGVSHALIEEGRALDYAGWMEHSFFLVNVWNPVSDDPLHPSESTFSQAYSVGQATGTNPVTGSATWLGVMAGIDEREGASTFGNLLLGDAALTIDNFARPGVDLSFTNIIDKSAGSRRADISWSNVPLSDGNFRGDGLVGHFYGPNHEEAGGIFLRDQVSGAFGLLRE